MFFYDKYDPFLRVFSEINSELLEEGCWQLKVIYHI